LSTSVEVCIDVTSIAHLVPRHRGDRLGRQDLEFTPAASGLNSMSSAPLSSCTDTGRPSAAAGPRAR